MDKKKQLRDAMNRLFRMDYSTPHEKVFEQIDKVVNQLVDISRETAAALMQQVLDALKKPKEPEVSLPNLSEKEVPLPKEEVKNDVKSS